MRTMEDVAEGSVKVLPLVQGAGELRRQLDELVPSC
jgi:hypothetical protein